MPKRRSLAPFWSTAAAEFVPCLRISRQASFHEHHHTPPISASDVAASIGSIGPLYLPYRQAFIDNGIDGTMLAYWRSQSDQDLLKILTEDLGIVSSLHSKRVLLQLQKLWVGLAPT
jgi:hypothetical protein